jgi:hypothetical protein
MLPGCTRIHQLPHAFAAPRIAYTPFQRGLQGPPVSGSRKSEGLSCCAGGSTCGPTTYISLPEWCRMPRSGLLLAEAEGLELGKLARCAWGLVGEQQRSNQDLLKKLREHVQGLHVGAMVSAFIA